MSLTSERGSAMLLFLIALIGALGSSTLLMTSRFHEEGIGYQRARDLVDLGNIRHAILDRIDCPKVIEACNNLPESAELISRADRVSPLFARGLDGYQTIEGWSLDVECVPEGVLVRGHLRTSEEWVPVFRDQEEDALCQNCTDLGLSAPFQLGHCREAF